MNDKDFNTLKKDISQAMEKLSGLQKQFYDETGRRYYITGLSLTTDNADIDRKNRLLKDALEQLLACEWEVSMGVIAEIEAELKTP